MGEIVGDSFTSKKVHKIKQMLLDKEFFPEIETIDINGEDTPFGYFSISFYNLTRRSHMHWYELTVKTLARAILSDELMETYYRRVFVKNEDPVNLLFHYYQNEQN